MHLHYNYKDPEPLNKRWTGLMLGGAVIAGGLGVGSSMLANKNRTGGGMQIIKPNQPSWNSARQQKQNTMLSGMFDAINSGEDMPWYKKRRPILKQSMDKSIKDAYYGDPFKAGAIDEMRGNQVMTGLGRGSAKNTQMGGLMRSQADAYIQGQQKRDLWGLDAVEKAVYATPGMSNALSQDTKSWDTPYGMNQMPYESNVWDSVASGLGAGSRAFAGNIGQMGGGNMTQNPAGYGESAFGNTADTAYSLSDVGGIPQLSPFGGASGSSQMQQPFSPASFAGAQGSTGGWGAYPQQFGAGRYGQQTPWAGSLYNMQGGV